MQRFVLRVISKMEQWLGAGTRRFLVGIIDRKPWRLINEADIRRNAWVCFASEL